MAYRALRTIVTSLVLLGIVGAAVWWSVDRRAERSVSDAQRLRPASVEKTAQTRRSSVEQIPSYLRVPLELEEGSMLDLVPRYRPDERVLDRGWPEYRVPLVPRKIKHLPVPEALEKGSQLDSVPPGVERRR